MNGRVVDESGAAVAGARVRAGEHLVGGGERAVTGAALEPVQEAVTDANGRFVIDRLGTTAIAVMAETSAGLAPAIVAPAGHDAAELTLTIAAAAAVRGKVTVAGRLAAGARVVARPHGDAIGSYGMEYATTSGEDGSFSFPRLPPGNYLVVASYGVPHHEVDTSSCWKPLAIRVWDRAS
jgi:hypothetical protein